MSGTAIPFSFVGTVLKNGIGRHVCQLQRITIKFCKTHGSSRQTRDFIEEHLLEFTRSNPGIAIYLKPRRFRAPCVVANYLNGNEKSIALSEKTPLEICQWINLLRTSSGTEEQRLIKSWKTDTPSIQGVWTPYTNKKPHHSTIEYPSDSPEFVYKPRQLSASEHLIEIAKK